MLIVSPQGIPLVRDPSKPSPLFWKLPGGHGEAGEDARMCAIREIKEETGIDLNGAELTELEVMDRGTHTLTIFRVDLPSLSGISQRGNEGEEVRVFSPPEIFFMKNFMPNHFVVIRQILQELSEVMVH